MLTKMLEDNAKIIISTGNVLNVNKKAGQKPTEELIDCLKATLTEPLTNLENAEIHRANDDLLDKINEHERNSIKIGAKLFLNTNSTEYLNEAVETVLQILGIKCLDNLILAYHPTTKNIEQADYTNLNGSLSNENSENTQNSHSKAKEPLEDVKKLWNCLEKYSVNKQICQLGISDLDPDSFAELHGNSKVHPTIAQINLSTCCVVPPALQEFCNKNDVQLLTHSDPEVILPDDILPNMGLSGYKPIWAVRYQVHVKCRGLLTAKGYIVATSRH
uniref:GCS light chain n=1 Tax=Tabanus bromius TaxID=304241 RepID=A0A0K8TRG6_TABBR